MTFATMAVSLEPLDSAEMQKAVDVLRADGKLAEGVKFPSLALNEPPKAEVLAFNRRGDEPGSNIDPRTVHEMLQADPTALRVVDVRTRQEVDATSIAGATNVPLDEFEEHIGELRASASLLVLLCESGNRARLAAQILERHDVDRYRVLQGGMRGWVKAGLPRQGGRRDRRVRSGRTGGRARWPPAGNPLRSGRSRG